MKKVSAVMRWVGPIAIVGATLAVISDQLGLVVHLPEAGADTMGYHAVGSGLFLFVLMLLLVGMIGLYAGRNDPSGPRVIEYGDRHARYVLVEDSDEAPQAEPAVPRTRSHRPDASRLRTLSDRSVATEPPAGAPSRQRAWVTQPGSGRSFHEKPPNAPAPCRRARTNLRAGSAATV
jgi:hypothetical protein